MATRAVTIFNPPNVGFSSGGVLIYVWTGLLNGDYGEAISVPALADRSVQMLGALGTGGAISMYGSNKVNPDLTTDTDWGVLNDPQANALVLTALKFESIQEPSVWLRPKVTAGNGSTNLSIYLMLRK